jgi:hypothetical protein
MGHSSLPSPHFAGVMNTIRAAAVRCRESAPRHSPLPPSHHARHRARTLGLTVDTQLAIRCPHRAVSVVPLPVLDLTESPALSPLVSMLKTSVPFLSQDASASITDFEKMRLTPLTPFFLPSDPLECARDSAPEQLSSRFSASPVSPIDTPSHSYGYVQEEVQNVHLHAHKGLHEVPTAEMDEGSDCDMAWTPDACSRPQSYTSRLAPVSVHECISSRAGCLL